jgi:anti-sigma regulatory factor (Ser/Thr protein kinase)
VSSVPKRFHACFEADPLALAPLRRDLRKWLADVDATGISDIVLAVDEAAANAIEHAGLASGAAITVEADVSDDVLHVVITDPGAWSQQAADGTRGRGFTIMRSVMDDVDVRVNPSATSVSMRRHLRV